MRIRRKTAYRDCPIVLLGKGGSGTRLLSQLAIDTGVSLGRDLGSSLDSLSMVDAVYGSVIKKLCRESNYSARVAERNLRSAADGILSSLPPDNKPDWGFKLPECLFLLPEIDTAFPKARYAVLFRDPLSATLRRTHVTSRMDSRIGRVALTAAYVHCGLDPLTIPSDPMEVHNACAVGYQLDLLIDHLDRLGRYNSRVFVTIFEDLVRDPFSELSAFSKWLGRPLTTESRLTNIASQSRAAKSIGCPPETLSRVLCILEPAMRRQKKLVASLPERM